MNSPLESGLFLPLRFYSCAYLTDVTEQNRFKRTSSGVALLDETFIYANCATLLPFQIILQVYCTVGVDTIAMTLVCTDTGERYELYINTDSLEVYIDTANERTYLSYLGNDDFSQDVYNGKYYIELTVVDNNNETSLYYSDVFLIRNCNNGYDMNDYRITTPNINDKRLIDINANDLRIT